jgi:CRP-like cAMP-binding protein
LQHLDAWLKSALKHGQLHIPPLSFSLTMDSSTTDKTVCSPEWSQAVESYSPLTIRYPPAELIYQAETYAAGVYLVVQGLVSNRLPVQTSGQKLPVLEVLGPGDLIGLDALLNHHGTLHLASAHSITEIVVHFFERDVFLKMLIDEPSICLHCLDHLNHRFHILMRLSSLSLSAPLEKRLCGLLLILAERFGKPQDDGSTQLPIGITCDHLPELLAASRRQVRKVLSCLPEIRQAREHLIVSVEALQRRLAEASPRL